MTFGSHQYPKASGPLLRGRQALNHQWVIPPSDTELTLQTIFPAQTHRLVGCGATRGIAVALGAHFGDAVEGVVFPADVRLWVLAGGGAALALGADLVELR